MARWRPRPRGRPTACGCMPPLWLPPCWLGRGLWLPAAHLPPDHPPTSSLVARARSGRWLRCGRPLAGVSALCAWAGVGVTFRTRWLGPVLPAFRLPAATRRPLPTRPMRLRGLLPPLLCTRSSRQVAPWRTLGWWPPPLPTCAPHRPPSAPPCVPPRVRWPPPRRAPPQLCRRSLGCWAALARPRTGWPTCCWMPRWRRWLGR